ncbi:unnamed protein product [Cylicocyclus nassatus]|uniref:ETS domain-containing protein n=1 Tax=Cylicocyclus nassatus TaxID=53992 RepID=A0AA36H733_CYLNA|nr:unnamed protein product [Cylicocyclus nassatus]
MLTPRSANSYNNDGHCYSASPGEFEDYHLLPDCADVRHMTDMVPKSVDTTKEASHPETKTVPYVLSSQEKVDFLKKCCASPVLRFILHLLANPRQEGLVSWHGGPYGVKIWNTRKFTELYNAAMGARMNFTNISRALQACEQITIAGIRLWKRRKQGEYSFFPCYTGHGLPNIPATAMPKDVPVSFPFERHLPLKGHPRGFDYGECCSPDPPYLLPAAFYKDSPPYCLLTSTPNRFVNYQVMAPYGSGMLSPAPSLASFAPTSPAYSLTPSTIISNGILTPPLSDTSGYSSDSYSFNNSLRSQPFDPMDIPVSQTYLHCESPSPDECFLPLEKDVETDKSAENTEQAGLRTMHEPLLPNELPKVEAPVLSLTKKNPEITEPTDPVIEGQDIFGNSQQNPGYDLTIDETSLLYQCNE